MPRRNEDDPEGVRLQVGIETENHFIQVARHMGYSVSDPSNDYQDENHHWDRIVYIEDRPCKVEIKGGTIKKIEGDWSVLLEMFGKYGGPGWTSKSDAELKAGEKRDAVFVVANMAHLRKKLIEHYDYDAPHRRHPKGAKGALNYVKYRRPGNLDSFIWVPLAEVQHEIWEYPELTAQIEAQRANMGSHSWQQENDIARIIRQFRLQ